MVVRFAYELFDAEGELVERSDDAEPVSALFGHAEVVPALERALDGLPAGASRSVRLRARDAFGIRDPAAILEVDRADFPDALAEGDELVAEDRGGRPVPLKVLAIHDDVVVLDTNHPLAGQEVRLDVRVLDVRPATEAEIAAAEARVAADAADLVPLGRLLLRA
jgi:FKBP-type peptidyl-prolyl cis-trans isomerase SlyD